MSSSDRPTFEIKSEIYSETCYETEKLNDGKFVSKFPFRLTNNSDVPKERKEILEIEHLQSTFLKFVGLQIWRGAFLLADFIIANEPLFLYKNILELGAGVGLTGIVAGFYAQSVVCTDINIGGILEIIKSNFNRNKKLIKAKKVNALELDFMNSSNWSSQLLDTIDATDIVLAADVIYDDELTDAFIISLAKILTHSGNRKKIVYVAMEKRYVFAVADMETCAPCYEYFLQKLNVLKSKHCDLKIQSIPLEFSQHFDYERTKALVLWKITN